MREVVGVGYKGESSGHCLGSSPLTLALVFEKALEKKAHGQNLIRAKPCWNR